MNSLPTELLLSILTSTTPPDLPSLSLTSRLLHAVIRSNATYICASLARTHSIPPFSPLRPPPTALFPLQALQAQWHQMQCIDRVVLHSDTLADDIPRFRRGLALLCELRRCVGAEATLDPKAEGYRAFMRAQGAEEVRCLLGATEQCARMVHRVLVETCASSEKQVLACLDVVVRRGVRFVAEVGERKEGATGWVKGDRRVAYKTLSDEMRWKENMEMIMVGSGGHTQREKHRG